MTEFIKENRRIMIALALGALAYGLIVGGVCLGRTAHEFQWAAGLWAYCLFDLFALLRCAYFLVVLQLTPPEKKRTLLILQTFYWGTIKLACWLFLSVVLLKGPPIPKSSLLLGMGTLGAVPLLGGIIWKGQFFRISGIEWHE